EVKSVASNCKSAAWHSPCRARLGEVSVRNGMRRIGAKQWLRSCCAVPLAALRRLAENPCGMRVYRGCAAMSSTSQSLGLRATEELRSVADNLVQTVAATAFASGALLYLLRDTIGEPLGTIWLILLNCVGLVRLTVLWQVRSRAIDDLR